MLRALVLSDTAAAQYYSLGYTLAQEKAEQQLEKLLRDSHRIGKKLCRG